MTDTRPVTLRVRRHRAAQLLILGPPDSPKHVRAGYGHLWQWFADDESLAVLTLAARPTQMASGLGVSQHLAWETERLQEKLDQGQPYTAPKNWPVTVLGARAAAGSVFNGTRAGIPLHNVVVAAADSDAMFVLHVAALDTPDGRAYGEMVASGLVFGGSQ